MSTLTNKGTFTSYHAVGDIVDLDFQNSKYMKGCSVAGVKFTDYGKVLYDIRVPFLLEDDTVLLEGVDSIVVVKPLD